MLEKICAIALICMALALALAFIVTNYIGPAIAMLFLIVTLIYAESLAKTDESV